MKPTTEGSSAVKFDIVCMSFGKENEKGLKVIQGASKSSIFDEEMIIKAENSKLMKNNTLELENGHVIKFESKAFETIKENNANRKNIGKRFYKTDRDIR